MNTQTALNVHQFACSDIPLYSLGANHHATAKLPNQPELECADGRHAVSVPDGAGHRANGPGWEGFSRYARSARARARGNRIPRASVPQPPSGG